MVFYTLGLQGHCESQGRGQLKDGRQKAEAVGEAVESGEKLRGKGMKEAAGRCGKQRSPVRPKKPSAPLPCLWLWWITLISLQSLGFVYPHSRDSTVHWVLPVFSTEGEGPGQSARASVS